MIEVILDFVHALKNQAHILPLIKHADLQVNIEANGIGAIMVFYNGEISVQAAEKEQLARYKITGSQDAIKLLLEGKEKLRELEQSGSLKVNTPLRTSLLLESLFYLTKPDHYLEKII
ncbi:SCP2 sterol-binding domain-containing protein [Neobacillus kokaensis]|uniref:SCP2 domain-containing protein n=1 Tax=Neobacillus kokaensis TaxID=2759023 RepID=A0ABQ3N0K2_9BACI|nr:SCP2 sterol-binding domain-containing protein [Neobacillus kokaensis]GHH97624.1 hypothetical protein AM1BK_11670 [Neobacillus kokaensis]